MTNFHIYKPIAVDVCLGSWRSMHEAADGLRGVEVGGVCRGSKCVMGLAGSVCPSPTRASAGPHGFSPCIIHHLGSICPLSLSSDSSGLSNRQCSNQGQPDKLPCAAMAMAYCGSSSISKCDKWEKKLGNFVEITQWVLSRSTADRSQSVSSL